jgi:hypothetical protein
MPEQDTGSQQSKLSGAMPLLVSTAAAAAAGAIAVVARKALSGGGDGDGGGSGSRKKGGDGDGGTRLDDVEKVSEDLSGLVDSLRSEFRESGDYRRLVEIADTISEYADQAADAFSEAASSDGDEEPSGRRVADDLMSRISEIRSGGKGGDRESEEASRS